MLAQSETATTKRQSRKSIKIKPVAPNKKVVEGDFGGKSASLTTPKRPKAALLATDIPEGMPLTSVRQLQHLIENYDGTLELALGPNAIDYLMRINSGNRKLSEKRCKGWADMMAAGEWYRTGEVVIIAETGIINTGQHRIRAAQIYGKPVRFNIAFGIARGAFKMTDTGRPHAGKDVLYIMGVQSYALVSATLRLLVLYKQGLPSSAHRAVNNAAIATAYETYPDVSETTTLMLSQEWPKRGFNTSTMNALTWMSVHAYGEERTKAFLKIVSQGLTSKKNDAARQLREFLLSDTDVRRRLHQVERFAICLKALINWMDGVDTSARMLKWRDGDQFPRVPNLKM